MHVPQMPGHLIRRLHQLSTQAFAREMATAGLDLTPVQFAALDAIERQPGVDQVGVATSIAYDKATIGGVVDRLVQKGLVARERSETDRRARVLSLTVAGHQTLGRAMPVVQGLQKRLLEPLAESERQQFLASLGRLTART